MRHNTQVPDTTSIPAPTPRGPSVTTEGLVPGRGAHGPDAIGGAGDRRGTHGPEAIGGQGTTEGHASAEGQGTGRDAPARGSAPTGDAGPALVDDPNAHAGSPLLADPTTSAVAPFAHFSRQEWDRLASHTPLPLTSEDIRRIASLGDPIDMREVDAIYRPLSALLQLYVDGRRRTAAERRAFLREPADPATPFVIGIAGSVAVGKSTVARLLQLLLSRWEHTPRVDLVTTDGFLLPNAVLEERGIFSRKGFPESYDRIALINFLARVKAGHTDLEVPVYSHVVYDVVPGDHQVVSRPDILIVEGINVLQPPRVKEGTPGVSVSDYFDFSLYVDAAESNIEQWYVDRFLQLRRTAFTQDDSFFRTYAGLSDDEAEMTARMIWRAINLVNLRENIRPTRGRATMVFTKGPDHRVESLWLRKE